MHIETFGKTGCRRIVPGQYLAADPQGRAFMISAVEKQKLVGGAIGRLVYQHEEEGATMFVGTKSQSDVTESSRRGLNHVSRWGDGPMARVAEVHYFHRVCCPSMVRCTC